MQGRIAEPETAMEAKARQAYEAGHRAGEEAARRAMQAEMQAAIQQLADSAASISNLRADTLRRAEADTVKLAIAIARRVVHRELSMDGSALESLLKAALQKLQSQEIHRVRVHPGQEEAVKACLEQSGRGQSVEVLADPLQPKGGALFEIARGALDASVETQFAEIERGLLQQLETES